MSKILARRLVDRNDDAGRRSITEANYAIRKNWWTGKQAGSRPIIPPVVQRLRCAVTGNRTQTLDFNPKDVSVNNRCT